MFAKLLSLALAASSTLAFPVSKRAFSGRTTFYTTTDSNPMTACGVMYTSDDEKIVALSMEQFDMSLCNTYLTAEYQGKQVTAKILDGCETCSYGQIDLSPGAMKELVGSNYDEIGQVTANWWFGGSDDSGSSASQDPEPSSTQSTSQDPTPSSTPLVSAAPTPSPTPGKVFAVEEASASPSAAEASPSASATDASPSDAGASASASPVSASVAASSPSASAGSDAAASASAEPSTEPSSTSSTPAASGAAESQDPAGAPSTTSQAGSTSTGGAKQCKSRVRRDRH